MVLINKDRGLSFLSEGFQIMSVSFGGLVAIVCVMIAIRIAFYVLRSLGVYTLAKKNGIKNAFIAWIPYAWIYTACKIIGNTRMFGWSFDKLALWICILASVSGALTIAGFCLKDLTYIDYILKGGTLEITTEADGTYYTPQLKHGVIVAYNTLNAVNEILSLVVLVATVFTYINLFRKFVPQHYVLFAVLSVMGLFPIFVFVVRNKAAVNYSDYIRSRYYYYNDPYGQNPPPNASKPPEHPFEEFAERGEKDPGDPFSEFSDKDDK